MLGYMPMPADFKYVDVLRHGRPIHRRKDVFTIQHPTMPLNQRAKIFSPFDALKGFTEAVEAKDELYVDKTELSDDECNELNEQITALQELVKNGNAARENNVSVVITHFVPCFDEFSDAFGYRGQYVKTIGIIN